MTTTPTQFHTEARFVSGEAARTVTMYGSIEDAKAWVRSMMGREWRFQHGRTVKRGGFYPIGCSTIKTE